MLCFLIVTVIDGRVLQLFLKALPVGRLKKGKNWVVVRESYLKWIAENDWFRY